MRTPWYSGMLLSEARPLRKGVVDVWSRSPGSRGDTTAVSWSVVLLPMLDEIGVPSGHLGLGVERVGEERASIDEARRRDAGHGGETGCEVDVADELAGDPAGRHAGTTHDEREVNIEVVQDLLPAGMRNWPRWKPLSDVNTMSVLSSSPVVRSVSIR